MIYVTGDTFGDITRFQKAKLRFRKGDTVIVCGNFGFYCDKDKLAEKSLKWMAKQKYTFAFLHGAIDDIVQLNRLPRVDWNGGKAALVSENVYFLPQGEIYEIEGKTIFCFGGGENLDYLKDGYSDEFYNSSVLSAEVQQQTLQHLIARQGQVDYILTHDAPSKLRKILRQRTGDQNPLCTTFHRFLDQIWEQTKFSGWFFGKYRDNYTVAPYYHCIYNKFCSLGEKSKK